MPTIRDGRGQLTSYETLPPQADGVGPVERSQVSAQRMADFAAERAQPAERASRPVIQRESYSEGQARRGAALGASRARGAKAAGFVKGATKPLKEDPVPAKEHHDAGTNRVRQQAEEGREAERSTRTYKSPETRERMRQAQIALAARRRAEKAPTIEPQGREESAPATAAGERPAALVDPPPGPPEPDPGIVSAHSSRNISAPESTTPEAGGGPVEGEDRCSWARFLASSTVLQLCDRLDGHGGAHRGRLYGVLVTAGQVNHLGHAVAAS